MALHIFSCPKFISSWGSNITTSLQTWWILGSLSHVISQHVTFFSLAYCFLVDVSLFKHIGTDKRYWRELAQRGLSPHFLLKRMSNLLGLLHPLLVYYFIVTEVHLKTHLKWTCTERVQIFKWAYLVCRWYIDCLQSIMFPPPYFKEPDFFL